MSANSPSSKPRPIYPTPVVSLLLEPRSLVITTSDLYCSHLHGIDGVEDDLIAAHPSSNDPQPDNLEEKDVSAPVRVANWEMLGGDTEELIQAVREGGVVKRGIRTSLTCRVVERVIQTSIAFGGPKGGILKK